MGIIAGGVLGYEGELRAGEDLEQLFMDVIRRNGTGLLAIIIHPAILYSS